MPSSASADMEPIDLTLDDDIEIYRQPKRAKTNDGDDSDDDLRSSRSQSRLLFQRRRPLRSPIWIKTKIFSSPSIRDRSEAACLITSASFKVNGTCLCLSSARPECPESCNLSPLPHRRSGMSTCHMSGRIAECIPSKRSFMHPRKHRTATIATAGSQHEASLISP